MVQVGSAPGYDDSMDEHRPELREVPREESDMADEGLQAAVRGLVESVKATSRQFAEAAEGFARETMRVMEGFASRAEHSAGESRDMAGMAGRAAEEARFLSEALGSAIAAAKEQFRADVESLVADIRPQIDDAVRAATEALATARQAADDAQQRTQEAFERIEQSVGSSREAAAAAEVAADAARRSAEGIEQAAAEARVGLREEAARVDGEAAVRIEESLAASREAAGAAERAAEDARSAALEAMSYAAEARNPALDASNNAASQALLDRLEADYQLITELIQGLHARIADLSRPAVSAEPSASPVLPNTAQPPVQEADYWTPESAAVSAPPVPDAEAKPQDTWGSWRVTYAAEETPSLEAAIESAESAAPADEEQAVGYEDLAEREPESAPVAWTPPALEPAETARSEWTEHTWPATEIVSEKESAPVGEEEREPPVAEWTDTSWPAPVASEPEAEMVSETAEEAPPAAESQVDWTATWSPPAAGEPENVEVPSPASDAGLEYEQPYESDPEAATWSTPGGPEPEAPAAAWSYAAEYTAAHASQDEPVPAVAPVPDEALSEGSSAPVLAGRIILSVSPVPDFDRLLSLDGALGRLSFVNNVTLADYAKEEVTFRVELGMSISVEDFTVELAQMCGQSMDVTAVTPGQLQLRILRPGLQV